MSRALTALACWPNHASLDSGCGLAWASLAMAERASWTMAEQVRAISRDRLVEQVGTVDGADLAEVRAWVHEFTSG